MGRVLPRPVIALSTYRETARWGVWTEVADLLSTSYTRSVEAAGGTVVLFPPQGQGADALVGRVDGLIVTGGADVEPQRYGQEPGPHTYVRPDRDAWELALLDAALQRGVPTLGICRGMQLLAVHGGGRLEQHLPDVVGHTEHGPEGDAYGWTSVSTIAGSMVASMVGESMQVSCHHHQAVAAHPGFEVSARAADGTIEAIEDPERGYWVGVQWHPESGDDYGLFAGLVGAASRYAAR